MGLSLQSIAAKTPPRSILLVTGAPASGKSTVARALAEMLDFPLLAKDPIKESLYESLGARLRTQTEPAEELSRLLSRAAMEILWSLAPSVPRVILEANFRPKSADERARTAALAGRKLEVYCHCTPEEAARRFRERATTVRDHPAHSMQHLAPELLREFDRPMGLCPVIDVDTEGAVDALQVAVRIQSYWPDVHIG